ncbi:hypothetical protein M0805_001977 [Coniferiporia weirii]|nr:hypothetical protein M0805_001977 [Coniferiporia weirii]
MPLRRPRHAIPAPTAPSSPLPTSPSSSSSYSSYSYTSTPFDPLLALSQDPLETDMLYDPNAPPPRRKPYSPLSAFGPPIPAPASAPPPANTGQQRRSTLSFEIGAGNGSTDHDTDTSTDEAAHGPALAPPAKAPLAPPVLHARTSNAQEDTDVDVGAGPGLAPARSVSVYDSESDFAPPRPRFLVESRGRAGAGARASWSSQDSSLYPPSASLVGSGTPELSENSNSTNTDPSTPSASDSEREREAGRAPAPAPAQTPRPRSGVYRVGGNGVAPPNPNVIQGMDVVAALPPSTAAPASAPRSRPGLYAHAHTRRFSGSSGGAGADANAAHRRSSSGAAAAAALGFVPASPNVSMSEASGVEEREREPSRTRSPSPVQVQGAQADQKSNSNLNASSPTATTTTAAAGTARTPRPVPPPSSFRGSRGSLTGAGLGAYALPENFAPHPYAGPVNPDPLAPAPVGVQPAMTAGAAVTGVGEQVEMNDATSSAGHGSVGSFSQTAPGTGQGPHPYPPYPYPPYAHQYPYPYPYPHPSMAAGAGPAAGQGQAPAPAPRPHNAFMAQSAMARASSSAVDLVPYAARLSGAGAGAGVGGAGGSQRNSVDVAQFAPPNPPFAHGHGHSYSFGHGHGQGYSYGYVPPSPGTPPTGMSVLNSPGSPTLTPTPTGMLTPRLREPFLSPSSRRSSSVWSPPPLALALYGDGAATGRMSEMYGGGLGGAGGRASPGGGSNSALALPGKKEPLPSSALQRKISVSEKPWIRRRDKWERTAWWATFVIMWIGAAVGAVVCFFGFESVQKLEGNLCTVLDDDFSSFNTDNWVRDVELGGFGNGEFEMTTSSSDNLYIKNGQLYIMPTLTSDEIGEGAVLDGHTYNLTGCTSTNVSACSVTSKQSTGTVINPVKSARITTANKSSIAFGKVEVVAKLPQGDWLWPAIWMLPVNETYGAWPRSGEIDIMEARGNDASYAAQGVNFVRSTLTWGPLDSLIARAFGWQSQKRSTYASGFHTYTLEWSSSFIRASVDSRLHAMLDLSTTSAKESFWERGGFPATATNGSAVDVEVVDPWEGRGNAAPFDQPFYLVIDLAVGGTSGWFPDGVGGKMWFDGSASAMTDFANAQSTWYATWPTSDDDRAFRIDSVKMWKMC